MTGCSKRQLGIVLPWSVVGVRFDEASKLLTVGIDFTTGSLFAVDGATGEPPGARHGDLNLPGA